MAAEDVSFLRAFVGEEAVGRLRDRSVLAYERYAPAHAVTNLLQRLAKSLTEMIIFESCFFDLPLRPMFGGAFITIIRAGRATTRRSA